MKIGKVLIHFSTLASTNAYATEILAKSEPIDGTVISTDYQSAGRGQGVNKWQSHPEKNLLLSVILKPESLQAAQSFSLNLMGSMAVVSLINDFFPQLNPLIKWPNDITIKGKKIAGILIRNHLQGQKIISSICGFGINVNQLSFDQPKNGWEASSLYLLSGRKIELKTLLISFLYELDGYYELLQTNPNKLAEFALPNLLGYKEKLQIVNKITGASLTCLVEEIDICGNLKVKDEMGSIHHIPLADWKIVNK